MIRTCKHSLRPSPWCVCACLHGYIQQRIVLVVLEPYYKEMVHSCMVGCRACFDPQTGTSQHLLCCWLLVGWFSQNTNKIIGCNVQNAIEKLGYQEYRALKVSRFLDSRTPTCCCTRDPILWHYLGTYNPQRRDGLKTPRRDGLRTPVVAGVARNWRLEVRARSTCTLFPCFDRLAKEAAPGRTCVYASTCLSRAVYSRRRFPPSAV